MEPKDLVYFLLKPLYVFPVQVFLSTSGTYSYVTKDEQEMATIFSSKSVSLKSYSIIFRRYITVALLG